MYACVLIPRELSLVLTLHPNPVHVLEMSATVWSNTHLPPGAILYPDEGDVRLDRIECRTVIPDGDIRRFYGCYDSILNINGQEVRHCNWVRFVKTTTNPDDANIISSKVRGQSFYQVIRPIKPNEEIVVLFHLTPERSFYDTRTPAQFSSYFPNVSSPLSSSDVHSSSLIHQTRNANPSLITSTPLSTKAHQRKPYDDLPAQSRFLKFGSSPAFSSPHPDTPINYRCQRSSQHETSFPSPLYTSSSSRETSSSDNHSWMALHDDSSEKGRNSIEHVRGNEKISDKGDNNDNIDQTINNYVRKCETPKTSYDQQKDTEVDVVNLTNTDNDVGSDDCEEAGSEDYQSHDVDTANRSVDTRDLEEGDSEKRSTPSMASLPQPTESQYQATVSLPQATVSLPQATVSLPQATVSLPQATVSLPQATVSLPQPTVPLPQATAPERCKTPVDRVFSHEIISPASKKRRIESPHDSPRPSLDMKTETPLFLSEINVTRSFYDHDHSQAMSNEDSTPSIHNPGGEGRSSDLEDANYTEKDLFSSNEEKPFNLSMSAKSTDLQATGLLQDHSQLKRCRERTWWPCHICGKRFDRPSLLKRHTRTHTGEKPHACDVCGKAFSTSSSLNTHRRIHSGEKPHQCKTCGKRFTASSNLYYHRMTHNKEKPHKCDSCSKSFPTPGDLRSHMYIHNGSWPFKCDVCNRGFSKQTNLKNHMLLHSGDKPHECAICGKKFAMLCNLRTHTRTHENCDSSDCTECLKCGVAIETSDDIHKGTCKRCSDDPRRFTPEPSTPSLPSSLRQQRNTDFSISKLTSSDMKPKPVLAKSEQFSLGASPVMLFGNVKPEPHGVVSSSLNPHPYQVPTAYRQFFTPTADQHKWLIPPHQQFLPVRMTHPGTTYNNLIKIKDGQIPPTALTKIDAANHVQPGVPAFLTPEMMSLRGGSVFPAVSNFPAGVSLYHGHVTWGGHVIARGF